MFHPTTVDAATPRAVRTFISQVMDVYLADIHAMLRLPRPEVNIQEGCNTKFTLEPLSILTADMVDEFYGRPVVLAGARPAGL